MSKRKRAVKDVPIFLDRIFEQLNTQLLAQGWAYKENMAAFELRDKALFSLLVLTGGRASEISLLRKGQVHTTQASTIIANFETKKDGLLRLAVYLPKTGALSIFTETVLEWLNEVPEDSSFLIPAATPYGAFIFSRGLGRKRIWQIIRLRTGLFPHWFRGVHESIYGKLVFKKDAWKLKEHMGLKRLESTAPYVRGEIEAEDFKRLKSL